MGGDEQPCKRRRAKPKPLDEARLQELALAYMARFATTTSKLERYLYRKLRERGWDGENEPDLPAMVSRYAELGYVDDEAFARAKSGSLLRRGYGPRRVNQALGEAGVGESIREDMRPDEAQERHAALAMARKRGFGPFGRAGGAIDPARREKQIAAMMRAGHRLDNALQIIDARSAEVAEEWAAEADEDEYEA
ncbi:regulatory protein [Altererythrobacter atlanticus]|uniref:Regulatory protein RecX n=1 Tax=Croceibacterium atlanticum TaxID=1267766 RepID=A0A0F7KVZ8_9SPHN|nr:regulatory protein RecX [Croceibacterium atlanticum]AKH43869.1 recombination regulator RecX [Croceibacterium atlanticum]MBB5733681.1 regulatory protein [Croceibacterium atlanticum]